MRRLRLEWLELHQTTYSVRALSTQQSDTVKVMPESDAGIATEYSKLWDPASRDRHQQHFAERKAAERKAAERRATPKMQASAR
jgi:hypothetical protein